MKLRPSRATEPPLSDPVLTYRAGDNVHNSDQQTTGQQNKAQQVETKAQSAITRVAESLSTFIDAVTAQQAKDQSSEQAKLRRERLTRAIAVGSAAIALAALAASVIQVKTAHEALYAVQRAFVAFPSPQAMPAHVNNGTSIQDGWIFMLPTNNAGATVARQFSLSTSVRMVMHGALPSFDYPADAGPKAVVIALAPHQTVTSSPRFVPLSAVSELGKPGQQDIIFYGHLNYIDAFDQPHQTDFCFDFDGTSRPEGSTIASPTAEACPAHNCVDADCPGFVTPRSLWQDIP